MGQIILSNVMLLVGKYNMSGKMNTIALNDAPDMLDNTTMGHTAKSRKKGLDVITAALGGIWEEEPDAYFSVLGTFHIIGVATGGGATSLIDTTRNFGEEGIIIGSAVIDITDGGRTQVAGVTSISTTTNPNDTLNFAALTGAASFAGGGDSYEVIVPGGIPMTIAPEPTEGGAAYSFLSQNVEYSLGGPIGELLKFTVKAEGIGKKMVRGKILVNATKTADGYGTAFNLGAIGVDQKMYAALHVINAGADILDVTIESDSAAGFDVDPDLDQIVFAQVAPGIETYEWKEKVDSETDTWWRVKYNLGATGPFTFCVFAGII